jgi:hypothetical protein
METQPNSSIPGEYYLQGVREMASGFLLKPDSTFEFFFTYGALDRYGSGDWTAKDDELTLQSAPKPEYDFALAGSKPTPDEFTTVRIKDNNPVLLQYVYASLQNGVEGSWQPMDKGGEVHFPKQEVNTICLLFEFCPERFSVISIENSSHNDFEFRFEPWIVEVFFTDFKLKMEDDGLFGKHPLMEGEEYRFAKEK